MTDKEMIWLKQGLLEKVRQDTLSAYGAKLATAEPADRDQIKVELAQKIAQLDELDVQLECQLLTLSA